MASKYLYIHDDLVHSFQWCIVPCSQMHVANSGIYEVHASVFAEHRDGKQAMIIIMMALYSTTQCNSLSICCSITHLSSASSPNTNYACAHNRNFRYCFCSTECAKSCGNGTCYLKVMFYASATSWKALMKDIYEDWHYLYKYPYCRLTLWLVFID